jgi:hypothetical protein
VRRLAPRRARETAPRHTAQPRLAHQPRHALAGNRRALSLQLGMHPRRAVGAVRGHMDRADPAQQGSIGLRVRRGRPVPSSVVAGDRDPQHAGHDTDWEFGLIRAHEFEVPDGVVDRLRRSTPSRTRPPPLPGCRAPGAGDGSHGGACSAPLARRWSRRHLVARRHRAPPGQPNARSTEHSARTRAQGPAGFVQIGPTPRSAAGTPAGRAL